MQRRKCLGCVKIPLIKRAQAFNKAVFGVPCADNFKRAEIGQGAGCDREGQVNRRGFTICQKVWLINFDVGKSAIQIGGLQPLFFDQYRLGYGGVPLAEGATIFDLFAGFLVRFLRTVIGKSDFAKVKPCSGVNA